MKHLIITKLYLVILTTLILLSIFNIGYAMILSDAQNGLLFQTIIMVVTFLCIYLIKHFKDVHSILKTKYTYVITSIALSANLYMFLINQLYGFSTDNTIFTGEIPIPILLLFISIGFTISTINIVKYILHKFNPPHRYIKQTDHVFKLIISLYVIIVTILVYGSTNIWSIDFYTPRLSFVIFTAIYAYGPVILFSFAYYLIKYMKENRDK